MKTIVLVSGKARCGKNTFGNFIAKEFENRNLSVIQDAFANGVKNGSKEDFKPLTNWLNEYVEQIKGQLGALVSFNKNAPLDPYLKIESMLNILKTKDENWFEDKTPITRFILQAYGTEIFRKRVDTDWWSKQLKKRFIESDKDITIVTDVRFSNEIEVFNDCHICNYKIVTIRVERSIAQNVSVASHDSETALDNWTSWTYIIDNDSSLEDLKSAANTIANDILSEEYPT